jgi:undecaprenyl diphosphate synthase
VNKAIQGGEPVTEETFANLLWMADMPDPDLIVRTSGEQRLSNFLTWGSVYSELLFIDKHWPALTKDDFVEILHKYESRNRRRGK